MAGDRASRIRLATAVAFHAPYRLRSPAFLVAGGPIRMGWQETHKRVRFRPPPVSIWSRGVRPGSNAARHELHRPTPSSTGLGWGAQRAGKGFTHFGLGQGGAP